MTLMRLSPSRLKAAREARGLSPEAVAEATGCSRATVYNAESGARTPRADTLARWARLYGVTQDSLFEWHDEECAPPGDARGRAPEKRSTPNRGLNLPKSTTAGV
jgi:transcriptional regulator with XRE-family HTH domain